MDNSNYSESAIQSGNLATSIFRGIARGITEQISQARTFASLETVLPQASAGDLLEFHRGFYSHYALYLGNGYVMNICGEDKNTKFAQIKTQCVNKVCKDCPVKISNHDNVAKAYFHKEPRPIAEIFLAAESVENEFVPYEFDFRNCEYYCTMWRYGKGFSTQVANPTRTPGGLVFGEVALSSVLSTPVRGAVESLFKSSVYNRYQQLI